MEDITRDKDCASGDCPVDKSQQGKLVKSVDLPLLGNPYPPKDIIQNDGPNSIELGVRSFRLTLQPYFSPICKAYRTTSDIFSIGVIHSQNALQSLGENQGLAFKGIIIGCSGILGYTLARRKGIFKKLLYSSTFFGAAFVACFSKEAKDEGKVLWIMARNNFPSLFAQKYRNSSSNLEPAETSSIKSPQQK